MSTYNLFMLISCESYLNIIMLHEIGKCQYQMFHADMYGTETFDYIYVSLYSFALIVIIFQCMFVCINIQLQCLYQYFKHRVLLCTYIPICTRDKIFLSRRQFLSVNRYYKFCTNFRIHRAYKKYSNPYFVNTILVNNENRFPQYIQVVNTYNCPLKVPNINTTHVLHCPRSSQANQAHNSVLWTANQTVRL